MISGYLRQSTASQVRMVGPFLDDTDFKTTETALTIANTDVKLHKNGGASVNKNSGGGTHRTNGMYELTWDATDSNTVGELKGTILVSGALIVPFCYTVLEEAIYDALFASGAAVVPANVTQWLGSAAATPTVSGVPEVDVTHWIGTAAATPTVAGVPEVDVTHRAGLAVGTASLVELYQGGVWYLAAGGAAGTVVGVNGLPSNTSSVFADAVTLAGSTGLKRLFNIGEAVTLAGNVGEIEIVGIGASSIDVSGRTCDQTVFRSTTVTGAFGASSNTIMHDCVVGGVTGFIADVSNSRLVAGTFGLTAGFHVFNKCSAATPGTVTIDMATNSSTVVFTDFSGALTFANMDATNVVQLHGTGQITVAASCVGGTITLTGQFQITDNSGGAVTINNTATGVNVTQIGGSATASTAFKRWADNMEVLTVTAVTSAQVFACGGAASSADHSYIDRAFIFSTDTATAALRGRPGWINAYTGATKTFTVDLLNAAPQVGDVLQLQ